MHQTGLCAIVVPPCHFAKPHQLCRTTIARLDAGLLFAVNYRPWRFLFVLTGDVPYEPEGITLAELMKEYLRARGYQGEVLIARGETGSFREPQLVVRLLKERQKVEPWLDQLVVISSDWQLRVAEHFWRNSAQDAYLQLHLRPIQRTGGWRTRFFYAFLGTFIVLMRKAGLWPSVEPILYRCLYAPRYRKGFKTNACA